MSERTLAHAAEGPPDAPVLVLSASLGTTIDMWQPQMSALSSDWHVVRVDHPGHGASPIWEGTVTVADMGRAVLNVLDDLGHDHFSLCGLSLGGAVGQWIAAHAPQRVDRLILCSTAARFEPHETFVQRAATVRQQGMEPVAQTVGQRWFTPGFAERSGEVVERFRSMVAGMPPEGYAECCEAVAEFDGWSDLPRIAAPTLVIMGAQDPATPPECGRAIHEAIAGSRLEVLDPASHLLNVECAEQTTRLIVDHLRDAHHG